MKETLVRGARWLWMLSTPRDETTRQLVMEHGGHDQLTVKHNQPTLRQNIAPMVPAPPRDSPPSGANANPGLAPREE